MKSFLDAQSNPVHRENVSCTPKTTTNLGNICFGHPNNSVWGLQPPHLACFTRWQVLPHLNHTEHSSCGACCTCCVPKLCSLDAAWIINRGWGIVVVCICKRFFIILCNTYDACRPPPYQHVQHANGPPTITRSGPQMRSMPTETPSRVLRPNTNHQPEAQRHRPTNRDSTSGELGPALGQWLGDWPILYDSWFL